MTDPRTLWQEDFISKYMMDNQRDWLLTATPGSGKTRAVLSLYLALKDQSEVEQLLVVVPTQRIRYQWSRAAAELKIDLTAQHDYAGPFPLDVDGGVITYSRLAFGQNADLYRSLIARKRTLVVLDEIHHIADDAAWGRGVLTAAEPATRRVALSGTPFRSDGNPIPLITYNSEGLAEADYTITYGEAVRQGICRTIRFEIMDGEAQWCRGEGERAATAKTVTEKDQSALLTTLYASNQLWIPSIFRAADADLDRIRTEEKPNAGGLVVAQDIQTAKQYQKLLGQLTGEPVAIVHSSNKDDDGPNDDNNRIIDDYNKSQTKWIVAVNMISEGVDIPRLAVLVFASRTLTEMWFRQVTGRVVRMDGELLTATMFIPAIPLLVQYAEKIEQESDIGLQERTKELQEQYDTERKPLELDITIPIASSAAERDSVIASGTDYQADELANAQQLKIRAGGSALNFHDADVARILRLDREQRGLDEKRVTHVTISQPPTQFTGDQLRSALKAEINRRVKRYCYITNTPYEAVHGDLNQRCGDKTKTATVETLKKRLEILKTEYQY